VLFGQQLYQNDAASSHVATRGGGRALKTTANARQLPLQGSAHCCSASIRSTMHH
jgi:hypothetical protein